LRSREGLNVFDMLRSHHLLVVHEVNEETFRFFGNTKVSSFTSLARHVWSTVHGEPKVTICVRFGGLP
jgi:hypothetical protein